MTDMEKEKIFVLVPVYNVEAYLERCIDSIINQTYTNWELVLVDDGSPDGSGAICDRYAAEYDNITVIHQENGGVSVARNTAVAYAMEHGDPEKDWINFVDSDDFVHPKYLEYLYRATREANSDISSCRYTRTHTSKNELPELDYPEIEIMLPEAFFCWEYTNAIIACAKLYRIHLFSNILYPSGKLHEDAATTYKLIFQQPHIAVVWRSLYYWYVNPQSITNSTWHPGHMASMDAMEEQLEFFEKHGYTAAKQLVTRLLFRTSIKTVMMIHGTSPKYNQHLKSTRSRRNSIFHYYSKEFGWKKAVSYWIQVRFAEPAKRILHNESIFSFLRRRLKRACHR